jgi:hypothetical protein
LNKTTVKVNKCILWKIELSTIFVKDYVNNTKSWNFPKKNSVVCAKYKSKLIICLFIYKLMILNY